MSESLSVTEIDKEAKKLKRELEDWREIILIINSVLLWEKNIFVGIIVATTSFIFFLLWQMDPSVITLTSVIGIIITLTDFFVPKITDYYCREETWTSAKEGKLESICRSLAANKIYVTKTVKSLYHMRQERPQWYYIIVTSILLAFLWIGNEVNNLFFTYLVVTSLLLLPGIQHRGIIEKYTSHISNVIKDKMKCSENIKSE